MSWKAVFSSDKLHNLWKILLIFGLVLYSITISLYNFPSSSDFFGSFRIRDISNISLSSSGKNTKDSPTNLSHLVFGLLGTEGGWHYRKAYIQSWWRPNVTKGYVYLDTGPTGDLLPWSNASPAFRVSKNLAEFIEEIKPAEPFVIRLVHGILEIFEEEKENEDFRWLVMGDDDSIFFLDNIIDVIAKYDHTKYYYLGAPSEFTLSNFELSFDQGFGGAGYILSYPLAKALAEYMYSCLKRYSKLITADFIVMACISDIGVNLSPQSGLHQIDFRGDLSGFLSSHKKTPLMSLHHFDTVDPIFPGMDAAQAARHLMKAAEMDQSRMLQQTICYHRQNNWSFSISWGYSVYIYERIMPRSHMQRPIETFEKWLWHADPPHYMFNTRLPSDDPCEAPHVFFFESIKMTLDNMIFASYSRAKPRDLPACETGGGHAADSIKKIHVFSPATKRIEMDRCECCDIVQFLDETTAEINFRECMTNEILA